MRSPHAFAVLLCLSFTAAAAAHAADWAPSAPGPQAAAKQIRIESLRMAPGTALEVRLAPLDAAKIAAVRASNSASFEKRLQIGINRDVPVAADSVLLRWQAVDGGSAAQWHVVSPGAAALRIALDIAHVAPTAEIRFAADGDGAVYGPYSPAAALAAGPRLWSPVLAGEGATVEVFIPFDAATGESDMALAQVAHLIADPAAADVETQLKLAGTCEVDLICRSATDSALASVGKAVARMTFVDGTSTFLCTGTLLATTNGPGAPYFYTAAHCISTQAVASTLTTLWFFDRPACNTGTGVNPTAQLSAGATLLFANTTSDAAFLRLNGTPPAGVWYSGWSAGPVANATPFIGIHHPAGDVKKVSLGTMGGYAGFLGGAGTDHFIVLWNSVATGVTEGGSSGSGIFTAVGNPASDYLLRGGLTGGPSSCLATGAGLRDFYSRFELAYPSISSFLAPATDAPRLLGISTRMRVQGGDNVLIGGVFIGGATPKKVVINARGPSLAPSGVADFLANPTLTLVPASGGTSITNDDWGTAPYASELVALGLNPPHASEASILATLDPGAYTAIVSDAGGATGVGIVEVFEVDAPQSPLGAISTRGQVLTADNVMIGGFVISGTSPQTVVVRARGPSLAASGVAGALVNPVLQLFSGPTLIATNDDWGSDPNAAQLAASGLAPSDPREAAMRVTLSPGAYTAIVSGAGGATGVAIVEVFAQ